MRVREPGPRATNRVRDCDNGLILTNDALLNHGFHRQQFVFFALKHLRHRDAGPRRHDFGNFFFGHVVT